MKLLHFVLLALRKSRSHTTSAFGLASISQSIITVSPSNASNDRGFLMNIGSFEYGIFGSLMLGMIMPLLSQVSTVTLQILSAVPTTLVATQRYTPASSNVTFDMINSTNPSSSSVGKIRRLGRIFAPFRYQFTPKNYKNDVLE